MMVTMMMLNYTTRPKTCTLRPLRTTALPFHSRSPIRSRGPAIPPYKISKVGVGALVEALAPVDRVLVHDQVGRGARRLRGLAVGDDERESVGAFGVERSLTAAAASVRSAAGALGGELPVRSVDLVAGGEFLQRGAVVDGWLGVRTSLLLASAIKWNLWRWLTLPSE
jgi:hypothetical protein